MNYIVEIAKMLGVEIGVAFKCSDGFSYMFTERGIVHVDRTCAMVGENEEDCSVALLSLLNGDIKIMPGPWKPETDECFCYMDQDGRCRSYGWDGDAHSLNYYKIGNCYHTQQEAEINRDKWVEFYASDEVIEV